MKFRDGAGGRAPRPVSTHHLEKNAVLASEGPPESQILAGLFSPTRARHQLRVIAQVNQPDQRLVAEVGEDHRHGSPPAKRGNDLCGSSSASMTDRSNRISSSGNRMCSILPAR